MRYTLVGTVLAGCVLDPGWSPWQAGRRHLDGNRREDRLWPRKDFITFRDQALAAGTA